MAQDQRFPFPITGKTFIGVDPTDLKQRGLLPQEVIVPAWFGFVTEISQLPTTCPIEVTGRSQYKLFVNGTSVLFGPCRSQREIAYYDTLDIAPYLKVGRNTLVLQVMSYPEHPENRSQAGPNYCYGDDGGPAISVEGVLGDKDPSKPENWLIWLDKGMTFSDDGVFLTGATERVDGRLSCLNPFLSEKWECPDLLQAVYRQPWAYDPFGCCHGEVFLPRPIPLLYRREYCFPNWQRNEVPAGEKRRFVLDAGRLTTAYFRIGLQGGRGAKVRILYAESYFQRREDGSVYKGVRDDPSGFLDGMYDEILVGSSGVYEPFRFRTFRFVEITVEAGEEPLTLLPQPYIETAYPLENTKRPQFKNTREQRLYDVAFRTLQLCVHDTYEDCPYYEQLQYACDTRLEILFTYASTDDKKLPAYAIQLFASSLESNGFTQARFPSRESQIIPVFSLYFVMMLEDYVRETGDLNYIRTFLPIAERVIEKFLSNRCPDGLLAPNGYWDYFDWTRQWSDVASVPTAVKDGESVLQNLFFVYATQSFIRLLQRFGRWNQAAEYAEECNKLLDLVEQLGYDCDKGLYREGPRTDEYSQHTQIYAVLTGLVKGEQARKIMERVLTDPTLVQCSFMQNFYLFRALEKVGMYDETLKLWDKWESFLQLHCTTFPETPFDPRSDCHGWSALPLYEMSLKRLKDMED